MSVIIRLQNLPWTANALDIRRFFSGLGIPDGGVHIVGGEKGDAFIAFSTDEDARRAMLLDGGRIGTNALKLFLSSKTEMQNVIAIARGGAPVPSGGGNQGAPPPMGGLPPQNPQFQPQQPVPNMPNQNFAPHVQQGYPQGGGMMPQQNIPNQGQMRGSMPIEQRPQGLPPPYGAPQPMEPMVAQGRHDDRPPWDSRESDPRDRGDFGRRDMGHGGFEGPRDMEPRGFNGHGPVDGIHMMERPMDNYREPRPRHDDFRGHSPRRERLSPPRERFLDDRRDRRKRPFEPESYVYVSNMPTPLNYRDVRKFFTGLEIPRTGLKLINDRGGNRIGDAYVMFSTEEQATSALRMTGWMVAGRSVRIEPCSQEEFDRAVDSYVPAGAAQMDRPMSKRPRSRSPPKKIDGCFIVLKNVPFSATKKDIFRLLNGVKFAKGDLSVNIEYSRDCRPTGVALLELFSERDLERALRMHRRCELGGRTIEVLHISEKEYKDRLDRALKNAPREEATPVRTKEEKEEVKSEEKISEKERKSESKETKVKVEKSDSKAEDGSGSEDQKFYCVKMHGIPFNADKAVIQKFFSGLEIANKGIRLVFLPNGKASHTCFVEFVSSDDCKKALAKDKQYIGSRYINISPVTKKQMMDDFRSLTEKHGSYPTAPPGSSSVASQVGKPGCVVSIQNLHFNATLEDILHFFKRFGPIPNSVKMRYNQDGRPMGDAMLAFHSRADAQNAVTEMNRSRLMGRSVTLALV